MEIQIEKNTAYANLRNCHYIYQFTSSAGAQDPNGIVVFQIADVFCKRGYVQSPHRQWCDELTVIYGGQGTIETNGVVKSAQSGQIHLCFEGDSHLLQTNLKNPLRFFCLGFRIQPKHPLYETYEAMKRKVKTEGAYSPRADEHRIIEAFKSALTELTCDGKSELSSHLFQALLNEIVALLCKSYLEVNYSYEYDYSPKQKLVYEIMNYLDENVQDKDALKNLPLVVNYSYSRVSHVFSACVGETLREYFVKLRMHAADAALQSGKSVTETSDLFGYSSIHAFSRAYKCFFGINPSRQSALL